MQFRRAIQFIEENFTEDSLFDSFDPAGYNASFLDELLTKLIENFRQVTLLLKDNLPQEAPSDNLDLISFYKDYEEDIWNQLIGEIILHNKLGLGKIIDNQVRNNKEDIISIEFYKHQDIKRFTSGTIMNKELFKSISLKKSLREKMVARWVKYKIRSIEEEIKQGLKRLKEDKFDKLKGKYKYVPNLSFSQRAYEILSKVEENTSITATEEDWIIENQVESLAELIMLRRHTWSLEEEYGFKGPLHFTDFNNLKNIFSLGYLKSRRQSKREGSLVVDGADEKIINQTDRFLTNQVRFYYGSNSYTLNRNEGIKVRDENPHIPIPVYLVFDPKLIYLAVSSFTDGNAKSDYTTISSSYDFFREEMDWKNIFDRTPLSVEDSKRKFELKRKRQAELLLDTPVPIKYLKEIIFRCEADKKRAINILRGDKVDFEMFAVNPSMFNLEANNKSHNYISDYEIKFKEGILKFDYEFIRDNYDKYSHEYKIINLATKECIKEGNLYHDDYSLKWKINFSNLPTDSPLKFEYYINGILYIEEFIN